MRTYPPASRSDASCANIVQRRRGREASLRAFTLIEVLVSCALLLVLFTICYSVINISTSGWAIHRARLSSFERARTGFELLTNRLSQATLNTYWDYDNPSKPTRYLRRSELHFIMDRSETLLPDVPNVVSQSIFFLAPLGFNIDEANLPLVKTLSGCGFYIRFCEELFLPKTMVDRNIAPRYRYRLIQFLQSGEAVDIYRYTPNGASRDLAKEREWFAEAVEDESFPIADNVIGLILRANYTTSSGSGGTTSNSVYQYDSRDITTAPTLNQLPPSISVTMVMIDEDSAIRLAEKYGTAPPPILPPPDKQNDLEEWEKLLNGFVPKINYRIFSADVPIRGAKWSSD